MQRKLVQLGQHTLMAAMPSKWIKRHNLKKGDEVQINEVENKLVITSTAEVFERKTKINLLSPTIELVWRLIQPAYISGYDEVEISFDNAKALPQIRRSIDNLIGFEIIEIEKNKVIVKSVSKHLDEEFEVIFKRVFLLLKQMIQLTHDAFGSNDRKKFAEILQLELTINKYTIFLKRIINRTGYKYPHYTYSIISFLELAANHLEYIRRYYEREEKKRIDKTAVSDLKKLIKLTNKSYDLYYKYSSEDFRWVAEEQPHFFWFENVKDSQIKFNLKSYSEYLVQIARQIAGLNV